MPIFINEDTDYVSGIRAKLKENNNYCPCRLEKNDDTKCMCKSFREQIKREEEGYCHCGLYRYEKG